LGGRWRAAWAGSRMIGSRVPAGASGVLVGPHRRGIHPDGPVLALDDVAVDPQRVTRPLPGAIHRPAAPPPATPRRIRRQQRLQQRPFLIAQLMPSRRAGLSTATRHPRSARHALIRRGRRYAAVATISLIRAWIVAGLSAATVVSGVSAVSPPTATCLVWGNRSWPSTIAATGA